MFSLGNSSILFSLRVEDVMDSSPMASIATAGYHSKKPFTSQSLLSFKQVFILAS